MLHVWRQSGNSAIIPKRKILAIGILEYGGRQKSTVDGGINFGLHLLVDRQDVEPLQLLLPDLPRLLQDLVEIFPFYFFLEVLPGVDDAYVGNADVKFDVVGLCTDYGSCVVS